MPQQPDTSPQCDDCFAPGGLPFLNQFGKAHYCRTCFPNRAMTDAAVRQLAIGLRSVIQTWLEFHRGQAHSEVLLGPDELLMPRVVDDALHDALKALGAEQRMN